MQYSREEHIRFLDEVLRAQTEVFRQKLDTRASFMLQERDELFLAQFVKFSDGEMILRFPNSRGLPRRGEYLYCFTLPQDLRNYRNWGNITYGELIKQKDNFTECVCIWHDNDEEKEFSIAGFRGVALEFSSHIHDAKGMILALGPNQPPYQYLTNLQAVAGIEDLPAVGQILDLTFANSSVDPVLLDGKTDILSFVQSQLQMQDCLIIEGPPGTGKTRFIASLIVQFASENKSILVTALTNQALMEIAGKEPLHALLQQKAIFKTNLSLDENLALPSLVPAKESQPMPGKVLLSTFYIASGQALKAQFSAPFDIVVMDEASQGLLAMFAASRVLGRKSVWIGDASQLAPIVTISEDKVRQKNYSHLVDGFYSLSGSGNFPVFQFTQTYRLTPRAASYTGIFYKGTLHSKAKTNVRLVFDELPVTLKKLLHPHGGPVLISTSLQKGVKSPENGLDLTIQLVKQILQVNEKLHISVLSFFIETTKALQKKAFMHLGYQKNVLIETVSSIQGLTTDICIYFIPNTNYIRSLGKRLFNVATSRSTRHTIIIADNEITNENYIDQDVALFLNKLKLEFSFAFDENESFTKLFAR